MCEKSNVLCNRVPIFPCSSKNARWEWARHRLTCVENPTEGISLCFSASLPQSISLSLCVSSLSAHPCLSLGVGCEDCAVVRSSWERAQLMLREVSGQSCFDMEIMKGQTNLTDIELKWPHFQLKVMSHRIHVMSFCFRLDVTISSI